MLQRGVASTAAWCCVSYLVVDLRCSVVLPAPQRGAATFCDALRVCCNVALPAFPTPLFPWPPDLQDLVVESYFKLINLVSPLCRALLSRLVPHAYWCFHGRRTCKIQKKLSLLAIDLPLFQAFTGARLGANLPC